MPGPFYNQPYENNRLAMGELVKIAKAPPLTTFSTLPLPRLPFKALDMVSTGALQTLISGLAGGKRPAAAKGVHRNEWGYLPGNRYSAGTEDGKLTTQLFGQPIQVLASSCMFEEFYFDDGSDLKKGIKNADRRIVYDNQGKSIYLTLVHYDQWVVGSRNADGSPSGRASATHNPFLQIIEIS